MPGMRGWEIARRLRETRPGIPIVFTSGYPGERVDDAAGEELALAPVLPKPFTRGDLARQIREALDAR